MRNGLNAFVLLQILSLVLVTRSQSRKIDVSPPETLLNRFKRNDLHTTEKLWSNLFKKHNATKMVNGAKFAKINHEKQRHYIKFGCAYRNSAKRKETFFASFFEIKTPNKKKYRKIVGLKHGGVIYWAKGNDWPRQFRIGSRYHSSAKAEKYRNLGKSKLVLYASRKTCEKEQGTYRCTIFVKKRGKQIRYRSVKVDWITTKCLQKYKPKVKNGVGSGIPTTKNLNQFFYQFSSISGKVLTKSTKHKLANITSHPYVYKFKYTYKYKKKIKTKKIEKTMMKHTCRPTNLAMEKAIQIQAIVFHFKHPTSTIYAPIVGINDRGDIMWSDTRYWLRSYLCGPKRQRCDMAHGSLEKNPHLVMYTSDCKKGSGFYKCYIFIQFAGSPATEMVKSEIFFNSTICGKGDRRKLSANKSVIVAITPKPNINTTEIKGKKVKKRKKNNTLIIVGSTVGGVVLLIVIYVAWNTRKKMKRDEEKEEEIILFHRQKMMANRKKQIDEETSSSEENKDGKESSTESDDSLSSVLSTVSPKNAKKKKMNRK